MPAILALLAEVFAAVLEALGILSAVASILNVINQQVPNFARETIRGIIQGHVQTIQDTVTHVTYGNSGLYDQAAANTAAIIVAIGNAQQAVNPVILPTTPPTGYGGGLVSGDVAAIWAYVLSGGTDAQSFLIAAGYNGLNSSLVGDQRVTYSSPWFTHGGSWGASNPPNGYNSDPIFPVANILSTDTLSTFLERESFWTGWSDPLGTGYLQVAEGGGSDFTYTCTISKVDFIALRNGSLTPSVIRLPPIWPGVDGITYGTVTDFSDSFTITSPMDGIAVTVDTVPPGTGSFTFDAETSYRWLGSLAFFNDDDLVEEYQNLGFHFAVYTPKTMTHAKGVLVRTRHGATGRVWPWTINP